MENFKKVNAYVTGFSQENGAIFSQNQYSYPIINHTLVVPFQPGNLDLPKPANTNISVDNGVVLQNSPEFCSHHWLCQSALYLIRATDVCWQYFTFCKQCLQKQNRILRKTSPNQNLDYLSCSKTESYLNRTFKFFTRFPADWASWAIGHWQVSSHATQPSANWPPSSRWFLPLTKETKYWPWFLWSWNQRLPPPHRHRHTHLISFSIRTLSDQVQNILFVCWCAHLISITVRRWSFYQPRLIFIGARFVIKVPDNKASNETKTGLRPAWKLNQSYETRQRSRA